MSSSSQDATGKRSAFGSATGFREVLWIVCLSPLLLLRLSFLLSPEPLFDYISYWASGHLFVTGGHPYAESAVIATQHLQGWTRSDQMMTFCPPWSLPFLGIMALLPFRESQMIWLTASLLLNCLSAIGLWMYFGGNVKRAWIAVVVAAAFLPTGAAELHGQITPLMLATLTGFLLLLQARQYFVAGVLMLGLGFKPHLLYLVFLAVVFWTVKERKWTLLAGTGLSYGIAAVGAGLYNPHALDYLGHTFNAAMGVSCGIGGVLRGIFGIERQWLQFLPSCVGFVWFLFYWRSHGKRWDWRQHLPLLLLVSVSSSPYCWYHDFILVLPAFLALGATGRYRPVIAPIAYLCISLLIFEAFRISEAWRSAAGVLWVVLFCLARTDAPPEPLSDTPDLHFQEARQR